MDDRFFIDGTPYIPLDLAAKEAGLSVDYISRLCKAGKIKCSQVGAKKYADEVSLREFIADHEYKLAERKQKLMEQRAQEYTQGKMLVQASSRTAVNAGALAHIGSMQRAIQKERAVASADSSGARLLHTGNHMVSPLTELFNKSVALALAVSLTVGTYAAVDPSMVRFAAESARDTKNSIVSRVESMNTVALTAQTQLAAAAENPQGTFASLWSAIPEIGSGLARAFNASIDSFVYGIAFSNFGMDGEGGSVAVEVKPYARPSAGGATQPTAPAPVVATTRPNQTIIHQPVIERVIETERIVQVGGISEEYLAARLQELDNKFSSQFFALSSFSSPPASGGVQNVIAMTQRIDNLDNVTIQNPTITGGSITGTTLSDVTISGDLSLDSALGISSGGTGTSTAPIYGQLLVGNASGGYDLIATSSLGIAGGGGGTWGSITGTLSDQLDLQVALDAKISFSDWYATTTDGLAEGSTNRYYSSLLFAGDLAATTTDALTEGTANRYWSNILFDDRLAATTTLLNLTTVGTLTSLAVSGNTTLANATTTNLFSTTASSTNLFATNASVGVLSAGTLNLVDSLAVSGLSTFAGFISTASSTIGDGTQTGGLTVFGGATTTGNAYVGGSITTGAGNININGGYLSFASSYNGATSFGIVRNTDSQFQFNGGSGGFSFRSQGNVPWMTISGDGNFGIGTTSPTNRLEVAGNTFLGGNLTATGTLSVEGGSLFTSGFLSQASSTVVGNFTSTGIGTFSNGIFSSPTATSTFAGGAIFGSNALSVLQNGRIGIGTAAPTTGLDIGVATRITGDLTVAGGSALLISASGPITQTGFGQITFAGNVDATGGLDVTGANFTVGGANFVVAPGTGNITSAGTFDLAGALAASSTLQVTGASRFFSTLRADNLFTAAGIGTGLSVTNNALIGGTLGLTGAATFGSTLAVSGVFNAATSTFTGEVALSGKKITGLASPSADQDAANKTYVDSVAQGLSLKDSVAAATVSNITLSGEQTIDGVVLSAGDRVLVKNQNDETKNGIYVVSSGVWARSEDADANDEVSAGMFAFVQDGSVNASSGWVLTTAGAITVGSTALDFSQFSGAGQIVAGTGIAKSGNTLDVSGTAGRITANADSIDIASDYIGQSSITTVGTLTSGSLGAGFGNIDIGASSITAGVATFSAIVGSAITGSGNLTINGSGTFSNGLTVTAGNLSAGTASFSGNVALGGNKITGLADPTSAQEAATKAYVDAIAQGLTVKAAVRVASLSDITLSGEQTIDGVAAVAGDRVLVIGQSTAAENGIYIVSAGAWSRSSDANENSEVSSGMYAFVEEGTDNANTGWSLITPGSITLDTTALSFTQFSGSAETTAGNGLTKTGNTINAAGTADRITVTADAIDIAATYAGQSSILTVGALSAGSITTGFGSINIGSSALTAGAGTFNSLTSFGALSIGGSATTTIQGNSATSTFSGGISLAGGNVNLASGGGFLINNILTLNATTLGSSVVSSSLTSVGALDTGSITTGFGAINIGTDTLDAGATTLSSLTVTTGATTTNIFSTTASSTNLFSTNAQFGTLTATALNVGGLATFTNGFISQASSTIASTLRITGATALDSTLDVSGGTTLSSALTYGGVTLANSVTGTGSMVLSASPTLTGTAAFANATHSGTLGVTGLSSLTGGFISSASSTIANTLTVTGATALTSTFNVTGGTTLSGALTYGGVTLNNAVTGTGNLVLSASPTLTTLTVSSGGAAITGNSTITGTLTGLTGITSSGTINFSGLTASRLVATDGSKNLVSTLTLANLVASISDVTGSTGTGNLVLSASPTLTGTAGFANATFSGTVGVTGLSTLTGGFVSQASSTVAGNFTSTGIGTFASGTFTGTTGTTTIATGQGFTIGGTQFLVQQGSGKVGVGTASPNAKVDILGTSQQFRVGYNSTNYQELAVSSTGFGTWIGIGSNAGFGFDFRDATDGDFSINADDFYVDTSTGKVGVGTTTPYRKLSVTDTVSAAQLAVSYDTTRVTQFQTDASGDLVIDPSGNDAFLNDDNLWVCTGGSCPAGTPSGTGNLIVENKIGVGTTTPTDQLSVQGLLRVGANSNAPVTLGTATSTFNGDIKIIGKLDVSTIDPPYTIDGTKYATFVPSMTGVKEETTSTISLEDKDASGKYAYTINFDEVEKGSDFWLFYQISDFGAMWQHLTVLLTPSFDGQVFYKKLPNENKLVVYANQPGEVSMRLTGNRYDFTKWHNLRPDQDGDTAGTHVITSKPKIIQLNQAAAAEALFD